MVRDKLREKFGVEPPDGRIIKSWSEKLFETRSLLDRPRSGRPETRNMATELVETKLEKNPTKSLRHLSQEIGIPKSTVH